MDSLLSNLGVRVPGFLDGLLRSVVVRLPQRRLSRRRSDAPQAAPRHRQTQDQHTATVHQDSLAPHQKVSRIQNRQNKSEPAGQSNTRAAEVLQCTGVF
jgi:hypothetical protein